MGRFETPSFDDEQRLLELTHDGPNAGFVSMSTTDGDPLGGDGITYDHSQVGDMMRPDGIFGAAVSESILYDGLDDEQLRVKAMLEEAMSNPEIDLW